MAVLSDPDRAALWSKFMADASATRDQLPITKSELRAAVDAIDVWADSNAAAFNAAIPQPARGALTAKQKAQLFFYVVNKRFEAA